MIREDSDTWQDFVAGIINLYEITELNKLAPERLAPGSDNAPGQDI